MISRQCIKERVQQTAKLFGSNFPIIIEPVIYTLAERLSPTYRGGYWQFYHLSNNGFYMAPDDTDPFLIIADNGFEGTMTADALGITVCLYAYSHLSFEPSITDVCSKHYHLLRDYMLEHNEVKTILGATD